MKARGLEVRVGAVVVVATIIAIVGTMWFQKFQLVEKRYSFYVEFDEVGGLVPGDPIYVNGVERGRVNALSLLKDEVVVEMAVREGTRLPVDSEVMLKSIGIMGERFVAIRKGVSDIAVAPGDTLTGQFLMGLSEVMGSAGSILKEVDATARELHAISQSLSSNGKLQEGVNDFAAASRNLRVMTDDNRGRLDRALERFEHSTTLLDSLIAGNFAALDSSFAELGSAGGDAKTAAHNLARVSEDLKEITAQLRSGQGTAGRLIYDDELIKHLESTTAAMDSLLEDIRKNPGRYVKFSLF